MPNYPALSPATPEPASAQVAHRRPTPKTRSDPSRLRTDPVRAKFRSSTKRRAAWACLPCRNRKVRCNVTVEQPCLNCKHDGFHCYLSFQRNRKGMPDVEPSSCGRKELHFGSEQSDEEKGSSGCASPQAESASPKAPGDNFNYLSDSSASEQTDEPDSLDKGPRLRDHGIRFTEPSAFLGIMSPTLTDNNTFPLLASSSGAQNDEEIEEASSSIMELNPSVKLLRNDLVGWEGCSVGLEFEEILGAYLDGNASSVSLSDRYSLVSNEKG